MKVIQNNQLIVARPNLTELSEIEKRTYEFIRQTGEIQIRNLPDKRMIGAIANLKNKGLIEVHKKYTSRFRRKKKKFVRVSVQETV